MRPFRTRRSPGPSPLSSKCPESARALDHEARRCSRARPLTRCDDETLTAADMPNAMEGRRLARAAHCRARRPTILRRWWARSASAGQNGGPVLPRSGRRTCYAFRPEGYSESVRRHLPVVASGLNDTDQPASRYPIAGQRGRNHGFYIKDEANRLILPACLAGRSIPASIIAGNKLMCRLRR